MLCEGVLFRTKQDYDRKMMNIRLTLNYKLQRESSYNDSKIIPNCGLYCFWKSSILQYHLKKGYLLTFSFNRNKKTGMFVKEIKDKTILEVIV